MTDIVERLRSVAHTYDEYGVQMGGMTNADS